MIILVSSQKSPTPNIFVRSVQPHYGSGILGNVYLLALDNTRRVGSKNWQRPIAVMGVVDHLGLGGVECKKSAISRLIFCISNFVTYSTWKNVKYSLWFLWLQFLSCVSCRNSCFCFPYMFLIDTISSNIPVMTDFLLQWKVEPPRENK